MNNQPKIYQYKTLRNLVTRLRNDLESKKYLLLFAYNGIGKTRLSMAFKNFEKNGDGGADTLYFNAFTEDLFTWDNNLKKDNQSHLKINADSKFFDGFKELVLEEKISNFLERYADFDFRIDYKHWTIIFSRGKDENIKISRGEENIFIWCVFLAIVRLVIDKQEAYSWVKYLYIDDPVSSLDDNNAIAVASDLAKLLLDKDNKDKAQLKTVISSHHGLFFNVMCNELKKSSHKQYFLYRTDNANSYTLRATTDTPFFHHVAMLSELQQAVKSNKIYMHHFNILRSILEKTSTFFGFNNFSDCIHGMDDEVLFARAMNLLSHGKHSLYDPMEMVEDNKKLFKTILSGFRDRYKFDLPDLLPKQTKQEGQT